jgi:hypothetical protein
MRAARITALGMAVIAAALTPARDADAALTLTTTATPSFAVTLNGSDQAPTYALPMSLTDSSAVGLGWHLGITSTSFSTGGATPRVLPATASSITAVTTSCDVLPCVGPVSTVAFPVAVPAGATPPPAVTFFNAATATGTGQFTATATVRVNVAANSYAGTYASTLTLSIASGP